MFHEALSATSDYVAGLAADCAYDGGSGLEEQLLRAQADVERLLLITEALWNILKAEHGYEDETLLRQVLEVDLKDGTLDGKVAVQRTGNCPGCDRPLSRGRRYCLYCGKPAPIELFSR